MCNNHNIDPNNPFAGLEDESLWEDVPEAKDDGEPNVVLFEEDCPKCRGTGNWRPGYKCFKCKGKGKLQFKTSPEVRKHARQKARQRKAQKLATDTQAFEKWLENDCNPAIKDWLKDNLGNSFAQSLIEAGIKYGSLTENQQNAVLKAVARDDDAKEGFKNNCPEEIYAWLVAEIENGNEFAGSLMDAGNQYGSLTENQEAAVRRNLESSKEMKDSELDLSELVKGYYAVPNGETRLKVAIRRPGKNSRWFGWTFVDDGAAYGNRKTYGKQAPDGLYKGGIQKELQQIIDNPLEAMIAYGKLTGTCGKCGRILEDEDSIAAGIGPICASKM